MSTVTTQDRLDGRERRLRSVTQPRQGAPRREPTTQQGLDPSAARLLDELREARDAYLDALQRAYRAGISAHDLRAEGAVGRELE